MVRPGGAPGRNPRNVQALLRACNVAVHQQALNVVPPLPVLAGVGPPVPPPPVVGPPPIQPHIPIIPAPAGNQHIAVFQQGVPPGIGLPLPLPIVNVGFPPPPPPGGNQIVQVRPLAGLNDRALKVLVKLLLHKRGVPFMKKELSLMALNSTGALHFSARDLDRVHKSVVFSHGIRHFFACASCQDFLQNSISYCQNSPCRLFGQNPSVRLADKRVLTVVCNAEEQLKDILQRNIENIMIYHRELHRHRTTTKRTDCRYFPRFRRATETMPLFRRNKITVQLILSSDGFCFRGNERGSTWLTSAKVLDLSVSDRTKRCNTVILSSVSAGRHPNHEEFRLSLTSFDELVKRTRLNPIVVDHLGTLVEVRLKVTLAVMDGQAIALCFRIKGGGGYYGCARCYSPGIQRGHRHTWPSRPFVRRTPQRCKDDARLAINGVAGPSIFSDLVPMCSVGVDFLHTACEGLFSRYLEETFISAPYAAGVPRRPGQIRGLRLSKVERDSIAEILSSSIMPTYGQALLRSSKDVRSLNGSQIFEIACTILPVVVLEMMHPNRNQSAIVVCLLMVLKIEHATEVDKTLCRKLATILKKLSPLHDEFFGSEWSTIKKHNLFDHHAEDLLHVGLPAELSSAAFEKDYRLLKQSVELGNTRAVSVTAITRHVLLSSVSSEVCSRAKQGSPGMNQLHDELVGKKPEQMPQGTYIDGVKYTRTSSLTRRNSPSFNLLAQHGCISFMGRILLKGQSYTGRLSKKRHTTTQQCEVSFLLNGFVATGKIMCFGIDPNRSFVFAIISKYAQLCPFSELKHTLRLSGSVDVLKVVKRCSRLNRYWFRVNTNNTNLVCIRASDIIGPGCIIQSPIALTQYFICKKGIGMPE